MRLVGYLKKKSITMYGNMNVKFITVFTTARPLSLSSAS
jgi:hypothetical protein